jgi:hypothetical protein
MKDVTYSSLRDLVDGGAAAGVILLVGTFSSTFTWSVGLLVLVVEEHLLLSV